MTAPVLTSAHLLDRLASARDEAAWNGLVERHLAAMRWTVEVIIGQGADADDAVQDALLLIRDHAARFVRRGDDDLDGQARRWILRVAANAALGLLRRRRRRERHQSAWAPGLVAELPAPPPAEPAPESTDLLAVRLAVADLPHPYQEAIVMRYFLGLEPGRIAAELGCSPGTMRVRLHRALARLRRRMLPIAGLAVVGGARLDAAEMLDALEAILSQPAPPVAPESFAAAQAMLRNPLTAPPWPSARGVGAVVVTLAAVILAFVVGAAALVSHARFPSAASPAARVVTDVATADIELPEPVAVADLPEDLRRALAAASTVVIAGERQRRADGGVDYLLTTAPANGQGATLLRARIDADGVHLGEPAWSRPLPGAPSSAGF